MCIRDSHRIRNDFESINLIFLPGPKNGYRADELRTDFQNEQFFQNVILPGIALLPSIRSFAKLSTRQDFISHKFPDNNIFPRGYCIKNPLTDYVMHGIVTSRMRDEKPVFFSPPKYAIDIARKMSEGSPNDVVGNMQKQIDDLNQSSDKLIGVMNSMRGEPSQEQLIEASQARSRVEQKTAAKQRKSGIQSRMTD